MLTAATTTYLAVRRASGFALRNQGFQLKASRHSRKPEATTPSVLPSRLSGRDWADRCCSARAASGP
jgi:hypothetical protein